MVGRQAQLEELRRHLDVVHRGAGRMVLLAGEAGIGKTRLVREFVGQLPAGAPIEVLEGHCYDEQPALPYGPFVELLRLLAEAHGVDAIASAAGPLVNDLARLLPELAADTPGPSGHDPQIEKRRLFDAIYRAIRPTDSSCRIIVLEDLHWSDQTSQELIHYLARGIERDRVLLVGTYRTEELNRRHPLTHTIARLARDRLYYEIRLAPLAHDEFALLLEQTLERSLPRSFVDQLYERTEGNPFFVEEVLGALNGRTQIDRLLLASRYGRAAERFELPISIKDSILRRSADLDTATMAVLAYAAVAGRRFDFELLLRLTQSSEAELVRSLALLADRQLIVEEQGVHEDRYSFRHELIREAFYDDQLRRERRMKHRAVLQAMEQVYAGQLDTIVDQLAYHSLQARELPAAARYARLAGERAERMYAYRDAVAHYENALEAIEQIDIAPDPRERADLLRRLGHALYPLGDLQRCGRHWQEARAIYESLDDRRRAADMSRWLGRVAWELGNRETAFTQTRAALEALAAEGPSHELAMAYSSLSQLHMIINEADEAITWGEQALALAETLGDDAVRAHALNNIGTALVEKGDNEHGIATLEQSLELARRACLPADVIRAYINLGGMCLYLGQYRRAGELLREGAAYAEQVGWEGRLVGILPKLASTEIILGHWDSARGILDRVEHLGDMGLPIDRLDVAVERVHLLIGEGRYDEAQALLDELQLAAATSKECATVERHLVDLHLARGDPAQAATVADRDLARVDGDGEHLRVIPKLAHFCIAYVQAGREADAQRLRTIFAEQATGSLTPNDQATLALIDGLTALRAGKSEAATHFHTAATLWHEIGAQLAEARARRFLAESLLRHGPADDRDEARQQIQLARTICERLGAQGELHLIDGLARQHGVQRRPARTTSHGPEGLTPREREVLSLLARGVSNRAIAETLVISEKTVEVHVSNILGKLGLSSRAQAAVYAVEQGLAEAA
jgi:ATP/maltotriose-dependent transcriptional regulator MalT